jgi:hypothetical protein
MGTNGMEMLLSTTYLSSGTAVNSVTVHINYKRKQIYLSVFVSLIYFVCIVACHACLVAINIMCMFRKFIRMKI